GANVAGVNGLSATGNTAISFTRVSAYSANPTPNAYLFYNGNPSTINSDVTLTVTDTSVTIVPGLYSGSIGHLGPHVTITPDRGGDSRTIVLVLSANNIYLSGFVADNTSGGGALGYQNNGYRVLIGSGGLFGIDLAGDVTSIAVGGGTAGNAILTAFGAG